MRILAIETSCDETAVAVVEASGGMKRPQFRILSNVVASQIKIHAKWGGVVPNLAKREHQQNLPIVLNKALKEARLLKITKRIPNINLIAVTVGPGLEPALWVGINFAHDLNKVWDKPVIGVNHMEGHIWSFLLSQKTEKPKLQITNYKLLFPALALLVSGGHTELVLIKDWLKYKIIGQTRDDATGEAFDKVAKMLGLPYPGGPQIAACAAQISKSKFLISKQIPNFKFQIKLPRPMINSKNYDFSFSGLKTAVLYLLRDIEAGKFGFRKIPFNDCLKRSQLPIPLVAEICKEFQQAVIDVLISKTIKAAKHYKVKTIIIGGGVAANKELRKQFKQKISDVALTSDSKYKYDLLDLLLPDMNFTTDNAAMIAAAAYFSALKRKFRDTKKLKANGNLSFSTKQ
ncbi:MAG: tRNA (adenosine(37)-N6)-threonylcarbamoyltransferase complex transferase subunit TsaD [Patescibacteria group bacterium]